MKSCSFPNIVDVFGSKHKLFRFNERIKTKCPGFCVFRRNTNRTGVMMGILELATNRYAAVDLGRAYERQIPHTCVVTAHVVFGSGSKPVTTGATRRHILADRATVGWGSCWGDCRKPYGYARWSGHLPSSALGFAGACRHSAVFGVAL